MKVIICFLVVIPFVFTGPVTPVRHYIPEENDPNFKRFIYVENDSGQIELQDLRSGGIETKAQKLSVSYYLYTQSNQVQPYAFTNDNIDSIKNSSYDPEKLTMFVCHGWRNNQNSPVNVVIKEAVIGNIDINLFIIDWGEVAKNLYIVARNSVVPVGEIVGNFINTIQDLYGIDGSSFILVGHSLGAHVVGNAGAVIKNKIEHIIGLDPAGPLFSLKHPEERLDITDAKFVQVIHTDGALLGMGSAIGTVDYYPNGGMVQPGCGVDLTGSCSHGKAYKYFAESLSGGAEFQALLCDTYKHFLNGLCVNNEHSLMGDLSISGRTFGDYYLKTDSSPPYALALSDFLPSK